MEKINLRHLIPAASVFIIRARQTEKQTNKSHFPSKPSDALHLSVLIHPGSICVRVCEKVEGGCPFRSGKINFAARSWRRSCITCRPVPFGARGISFLRERSSNGICSPAAFWLINLSRSASQRAKFDPPCANYVFARPAPVLQQNMHLGQKVRGANSGLLIAVCTSVVLGIHLRFSIRGKEMRAIACCGYWFELSSPYHHCQSVLKWLFYKLVLVVLLQEFYAYRVCDYF